MFPSIPILKDVEHYQILVLGLCFILGLLYINYQIIQREKKKLREKAELGKDKFLEDLSTTLKEISTKLADGDKKEALRCQTIQESIRIVRMHTVYCENFLKDKFGFAPIPWGIPSGIEREERNENIG